MSMHALLKDSSLSAIVAGLSATLIGYAGPFAIIFQAARSGGLETEILASWVWAVSIGSGVLCIVLSLYWRVPVIIAWSAPGSALLVSQLSHITIGQAVGAYIVTGVMMTVLGLSGLYDRLARNMPPSLAAAMLAGILFTFGTDLFNAVEIAPTLILAMCLVYLLVKRLAPRFVILLVLLTGIMMIWLAGDLHLRSVALELARPVWISPEWDVLVAFNLALPLVLVALTGQVIPGMAVLRTAGYQVPASPIITATGIGSLLLAPFGCHGLTPAAMTAAICTSSESHENPDKRYVAGVAGGLVYLVVGAFGTALVGLFLALPREMIVALAGLALLSATAAALKTAMAVNAQREAALITFLVTASGMSLMGLSSVFWGLLFGVIAHLASRERRCVTIRTEEDIATTRR